MIYIELYIDEMFISVDEHINRCWVIETLDDNDIKYLAQEDKIIIAGSEEELFNAIYWLSCQFTLEIR